MDEDDFGYDPADFEEDFDLDSFTEKDYGITDRDFLEDKYFDAQNYHFYKDN